MRLIMPIIIFAIFACFFLVGCEERTVSIEGMFERVKYFDGSSSSPRITIIYFRDGSYFVIESRHVSVLFSRGTKIRITFFPLWNGNANGRKDLKIEKID